MLFEYKCEMFRLEPPYSIEPVLIRRIVGSWKERILVTRDKEESTFLKIVKPISDLWWDDLGIGNLVGSVVGGVVTGVVDAASIGREVFTWSNDIILSW